MVRANMHAVPTLFIFILLVTRGCSAVAWRGQGLAGKQTGAPRRALSSTKTKQSPSPEHPMQPSNEPADLTTTAPSMGMPQNDESSSWLDTSRNFPTTAPSSLPTQMPGNSEDPSTISTPQAPSYLVSLDPAPTSSQYPTSSPSVLPSPYPHSNAPSPASTVPSTSTTPGTPVPSTHPSIMTSNSPSLAPSKTNITSATEAPTTMPTVASLTLAPTLQEEVTTAPSTAPSITVSMPPTRGSTLTFAPSQSPHQPTTRPSVLSTMAPTQNDGSLSYRGFNVDLSFTLYGMSQRIHDKHLEQFGRAVLRFISENIPTVPNVLVQVMSVTTTGQMLSQYQRARMMKSDGRQLDGDMLALSVTMSITGGAYAADKSVLASITFSDLVNHGFQTNYKGLVNRLKTSSEIFSDLQTPSESLDQSSGEKPSSSKTSPPLKKIILASVGGVASVASLIILFFCRPRNPPKSTSFDEYETDDASDNSNQNSTQDIVTPPSLDSSGSSDCDESMAGWSFSAVGLNAEATESIQKSSSIDTLERLDTTQGYHEDEASGRFQSV